MQSHAGKLVLIGLDAPIVKSIQKYISAGALPNIKRLVRSGVWAENCLVPFPTITPPNWTTIVTGSWPGTHCITCFNVHQPGTELDKAYMGFWAKDCKSEYIWNAAKGKRSIVLNYPTTWPRAVRNGIQVGGGGLALNEWAVDPGWWKITFSVSTDLLFSTEQLPLSTKLRLEPARSWRNLPRCKRALQADLDIEARSPRYPVQKQRWHMAVLDTTGRGFEKVLISDGKDGSDPMAVLKPGQWSGKIVRSFRVAGKTKKAVFRMKLLKLSRDGKQLSLYITPICQLDGWATPAKICRELDDVEGMPLPNSHFTAFKLGWIDSQTFLEMIETQHVWYAAAAEKLMKNHQWDMFFMHAHCPDHAYHSFINKLDPDVCPDSKLVRTYQRLERDFYASLDRMIGRIVRAAGPGALVVLVSDHGAVPTAGALEPGFKGFTVGELLTKAGLTVYKRTKKGQRPQVDWRRTKAFAQRSVYVYINLKGRDPHGIVKPGKEYDGLCDKIIDLLYDYTDPRTGKKPIALALKKRDARLLGLYGDYIGDIVYAVHPEVDGEHGRQLPTGEFGIGSMKGLLVMSGPGVKRNLRLQRTVWLTDIVPTVCYLMGLPVPRDAEGAVIYQALADPNAHLKLIGQLPRNLQRLEEASTAYRHLTHTYEG